MGRQGDSLDSRQVPTQSPSRLPGPPGSPYPQWPNPSGSPRASPSPPPSTQQRPQADTSQGQEDCLDPQGKTHSISRSPRLSHLHTIQPQDAATRNGVLTSKYSTQSLSLPGVCARLLWSFSVQRIRWWTEALTEGLGSAICLHVNQSHLHLGSPRIRLRLLPHSSP